jgi:hypothetical protein
MTTAGAKRAVVAVGCLLALTIALLGRTGPPGAERRAPRPTPAVERADVPRRSVGARPAAHTPHGPEPGRYRRARDAVRGVATRFVGALLRYQQARPTVSWRRPLVASASARLARELERRPPRPPRHGRPPDARLRSLDLHGRTSRAVKASVLIDYGHGRPGLLEFELRRLGGGWRVSALYR